MRSPILNLFHFWGNEDSLVLPKEILYLFYVFSIEHCKYGKKLRNHKINFLQEIYFLKLFLE
nr:MAG TPA: hypothetical protein [Bacteriophage sp.]